MIRQIFAEMNDAELAKAAFIQITAKDTLADVNREDVYKRQRKYIRISFAILSQRIHRLVNGRQIRLSILRKEVNIGIFAVPDHLFDLSLIHIL